MHKWFTSSNDHIFWSQICNNVSYVANHDQKHQVLVSYSQDVTVLDKSYKTIICLTSSTDPYRQVYYYGKLIKPIPVVTNTELTKEIFGAVQTALSIEEYTSLTRFNPNLILHSYSFSTHS